MPTKTEKIHGFWLIYDDELYEGVRYLRDDLQYNEAKTLFDAARLTGNAAEFEDDFDHDWSLIYNHGENNYTLILRQKE